MKLEVIQVDAWREPEGSWIYNDCIPITTIEVKEPTPRRLLKALRNENLLGQKSNFTIDDYLDYDGIWTVLYRGTAEPLYDLKEIKDE